MLLDFEVYCLNCQTVQMSHPAYTCTICNHSLDIRYHLNQAQKDYLFQLFSSFHSLPQVWSYYPLLPLQQHTAPVTLGEGCTPLLDIDIQYTSGQSSMNVYLKLESQNPTLSFKDRPLSVGISFAQQLGLKQIVTASTGNTGVATAAYAARAKLECHIYIPSTTTREKIEAMKQYGATLDIIDGNFSDAYDYASSFAQQNRAFNVTSTYLNPYAIEGNKTIAYEIYLQLKKVPDIIIVPIGAGPLLTAIYKGFNEMKELSIIETLPKMVGVQAEGCSPIAEAFLHKKIEVEAWVNPISTAASAIADPLTRYAQDGTRTLETIRVSKGYCLTVNDEEMNHYRNELARSEGILGELSSVASVVAINKLRDLGFCKGSDQIVSIVTGHGFKDQSVSINKY